MFAEPVASAETAGVSKTIEEREAEAAAAAAATNLKRTFNLEQVG